MANNNYPQTYPGFQYFPPPSAWIDPNSVPSDDNKTPTWVIIGIVIIIVMLCGFLFYYIRRREKKIRKKVALASPPATKPPPPATPKKEEKKEEKPKEKPPAPARPPPLGIPIAHPGDCPSCGYRGGLYSFKYACPQCKWKLDQSVGY